MRTAVALLISVGLVAPAMAHGASASRLSRLGQPPQVWDHEPRRGDRIRPFQIILVDDRTCPSGQIKQYTAGSGRLGVRPTRQCIAR